MTESEFVKWKHGCFGWGGGRITSGDPRFLQMITVGLLENVFEEMRSTRYVLTEIRDLMKVGFSEQIEERDRKEREKINAFWREREEERTSALIERLRPRLQAVGGDVMQLALDCIVGPARARILADAGVMTVAQFVERDWTANPIKSIAGGTIEKVRDTLLKVSATNPSIATTEPAR